MSGGSDRLKLIMISKVHGILCGSYKSCKMKSLLMT